MGKKRIYLILNEYFMISGLLIDPSGFKEFLVLQAEKRALGHSLSAALCINRNLYGLSEKDWLRFRPYFDRGTRMFTRLLPMLEKSLTGPDARDAFFKCLGSWSYHGFHHEEAVSGLPLEDLEELTFERERNKAVLS